MSKQPSYAPRERHSEWRWVWIPLLGSCAVALILLMTGCTTPGYVSAEALKGPVFRIIDREAVYAEADTTLNPQQREANERDGVLVKLAINTALEKAEEENNDEEE